MISRGHATASSKQQAATGEIFKIMNIEYDHAFTPLSHSCSRFTIDIYIHEILHTDVPFLYAPKWAEQYTSCHVNLHCLYTLGLLPIPCIASVAWTCIIDASNCFGVWLLTVTWLGSTVTILTTHNRWWWTYIKALSIKYGWFVCKEIGTLHHTFVGMEDRSSATPWHKIERYRRWETFQKLRKSV